MELDLEGNHIQVDGAKALGVALPHAKNLRMYVCACIKDEGGEGM